MNPVLVLLKGVRIYIVNGKPRGVEAFASVWFANCTVGPSPMFVIFGVWLAVY